MATRKQIAERILRILQGGDINVDSDIDIREIMLHVDSERDAIIQKRILESYKPANKRSVAAPAPHDVIGNYISESIVSTSMDSNRDQRYFVIPQIPIDLPDGAGVLYVRDANDLNTTFSRVSAGTESLFIDLPSFSAARREYYVWVGNRIYFGDTNPPSRALIGLVAMSSSIGDTDMYPLSPGDEYAVIQSVIDLYNLMNTVKQDFINDNIDQ